MATSENHLAYKLYLQQVARSVRPSASEVIPSEVVGGTAEFELYLPTGWHGGVLAMQLAVDGARIGTEVYFFDDYLGREYYRHGAPGQRALDRLVDAHRGFLQLAAAGAKVRSWKARTQDCARCSVVLKP